MSVLCGKTVRPRVRERKARAVALIDISDSPLDLAESHRRDLAKVDSTVDMAARNGRTALCRLLQQRSDEEVSRSNWRDFSQRTSTTRTKLSRAGVDTAARLMWHGYLSGLVLLDVVYGWPMPEPGDVKGEHYYLELAGRDG